MNHQMRIYDDVFEMLPNEENPSPMVRINQMNPSPDFQLFAKLEWMNPFGSVKDRAAWAMLRELEEKRLLGGGRGIVEPTSGNTGISLAAMARARGYHMRAVVPNKVPLEKKLLLKIAGAELDVVNDALCPAPGLGDGSINIAKTHAKASSHRYVMPNQYENEQNVLAHFRTTGPEIWRQTEGQITHLFCSLGTCGTVTAAVKGALTRRHTNQVAVSAITKPSAATSVMCWRGQVVTRCNQLCPGGRSCGVTPSVTCSISTCSVVTSSISASPFTD